METYDILDKHLNLDKIMSLSSEDKKIIMDLYNQMQESFRELSLGDTTHFIRFKFTLNTLNEYGYLDTRREENLDKLLG